MKNEWYYVTLDITKKKGNIESSVNTHIFSAKIKEEVYKAAVNAFYGYLDALVDFNVISLETPCVPSLDGYYAWNDTYTIGIYNQDVKIVANLDDIV